jgi:hypothetical protein
MIGEIEELIFMICHTENSPLNVLIACNLSYVVTCKF